MDFRKNNLGSGLLLVLMIGGSMVFSTLHSHHEVEWNHPERHLNTGTCLTSDTTVCPISGYLFKANFDANPGVQPYYYSEATINLSSNHSVAFYTYLFDLGRSPPFSAV